MDSVDKQFKGENVDDNVDRAVSDGVQEVIKAIALSTVHTTQEVKEGFSALLIEVKSLEDKLYAHTGVEGGVSMECGHPVQCGYADEGGGCRMCDDADRLAEATSSYVDEVETLQAKERLDLARLEKQDSEIELFKKGRKAFVESAARKQQLLTELSVTIGGNLSLIREKYQGNTPEEICGEVDAVLALHGNIKDLQEKALSQAFTIERFGAELADAEISMREAAEQITSDSERIAELVKESRKQTQDIAEQKLELQRRHVLNTNLQGNLAEAKVTIGAREQELQALFDVRQALQGKLDEACTQRDKHEEDLRSAIVAGEEIQKAREELQGCIHQWQFQLCELFGYSTTTMKDLAPRDMSVATARLIFADNMRDAYQVWAYAQKALIHALETVQEDGEEETLRMEIMQLAGAVSSAHGKLLEVEGMGGS